MYETLSVLVHADSKVGKSTLGSTCPPPILILDAEGSTKFLDIRMIPWVPEEGHPPPTYDGTWDACIVTVRTFDTMRLAFQWLIHGQHHFRSVVLDSISEIQRKLKKDLVGTEQMKMQDWGALLTKMDDLIRGFRDLTLHPTNPISVAMFIAETRETNGKYRPYMQGQIAVSLPYWVDIVGYLYVTNVMADDGVTLVPQRQLLITPHPQFEAGERVQGRLGPVVADPNIWRMLLQVYPQLQQATAQEATA